MQKIENDRRRLLGGRFVGIMGVYLASAPHQIRGRLTGGLGGFLLLMLPPKPTQLLLWWQRLRRR